MVLPKVDVLGGALWGCIVPTPTFLPKACPFAGDYSIFVAIGKEVQPSVNQMGENSATLQSSLPYGPEPNTILGATYYLTTGLTDEHMLYSLRGKLTTEYLFCSGP